MQDSTGANLAVIDSIGNMNIKGTSTQNTEPTADANDFLVQNSTGGLNLVITCQKSKISEHSKNLRFLMNPEGNMLIKNTLNQNLGALSPTLNSFIIQNNTGQVVAYVNNTGGLFLTGTLTEQVLFG